MKEQANSVGLRHKLTRALGFSLTVYHNLRKEPEYSFFQAIKKFVSSLNYYGLKYTRSIAVEQEVYYAHKYCWDISAKDHEDILVLESDIVFNAASIELVKQTIRFVRDQASNDLFYVNLAVGCIDANKVKDMWQFSPEHLAGQYKVEASPPIEVFQPPVLVTDCVAGYFMSHSFADELHKTIRSHMNPVLPPDWFLDYFSHLNTKLNQAKCFFVSPCPFSQGSATGIYQSSIEGC
ncbi:hypothetical protein [Cohaesibacter sp. ES.047]|uniref:hypothetical protein n=1 Tax=Cohaesibacter sp. ES.047 TaxID=1798205 RepID=UPI001560FD12|nr:hypothetical protein [Cohaesibacter sp. ES.047]